MKINYLISGFALLFLTACASKRGSFENKHGKYKYQIIKSFKNGEPVICGAIYDYDLKTPLRTNGAIKIDSVIKTYTNSNGGFQFNVLPGKYSFTAAGFPYEFLDTKNITVKAGDTVRFLIYLQVYHKPIP